MSIPNVTYYIVPITDYGWLYNKNALNGVSAEVLRIRFIWYGCFWTYQTTLSIYYSIFIMVFGITLLCAWRKIDFCVFVRILYICQISIHCYALHFKITLKPIIRVFSFSCGRYIHITSTFSKYRVKQTFQHETINSSYRLFSIDLNDGG